MAKKPINKKPFKIIPGVVVKCNSGRYVAFYEHRTDIIANGDNEIEARKNLKKMYDIVIKHEKEETENELDELPANFSTSRFREKVRL